MRKYLIYLLSGLILISLGGCVSVNNKETARNEVRNSKEMDKNIELEKDKSKDLLKKESDSEKITEAGKSDIENVPKMEEDTLSINRKTVVIDPGHSSRGNSGMEKQSPDSDIIKIKDPGGAQGISSGTPEYVVALSVSLKLKALLEQRDITVIMTKTTNSESPGNIERAEVGNINNANLSIRIHCDSADSKSARGASMLVPAPVGYAKEISAVSKRYGQVILNDLVASAGMNNRGVVERSDLTGFNWSKVPVVLVEMGFMSNPEEDKLLNDDNYQNKLAEGLCNGIINALQI